MTPDSTRTRILDGFADQLLEFGYRGVSLRAIAENVGVKKPSLYHHFPDGKEQIYAEVAVRMIDEDTSRVATALEHEDLHSRLIALALLHAQDARKIALDQRLYDATRYVSDETRTYVSTRYVDGLLTPVREMMAEAVAAGELRALDPELLMQMFFGMSTVVQGIPEDVAMPPQHRGESTATVAELAAGVVDVFLSGASRTDGP